MAFAGLALNAGQAFGQNIAAPEGAVTAPQPAVADCRCGAIPALTVVSLEILAPLGTKLSKTGETFPIRLAGPIMVGGHELVPAGTTGIGEVVHAKKGGGSGAGGELILAARYLDLDGRRLRLRSMKLSSRGKDQELLVLAASELVGPFALAVSGRNSVIAAGTLAEAKTSEEFVLPSR